MAADWQRTLCGRPLAAPTIFGHLPTEHVGTGVLDGPLPHLFGHPGRGVPTPIKRLLTITAPLPPPLGEVSAKPTEGVAEYSIADWRLKS